MSSETRPAQPPLDLSKWRNVPLILMVVGGLLSIIGFFTSGSGHRQFAFSWLQAFMFFLSLCAGGLFLVLVHHLFDASWSVPIRRINENLAALFFPWLFLLFIPIALLAPSLYEWMNENPDFDHALAAKRPLFTMPGFYAVAAFCFLAWWWLSNRLRYWSVTQDKTGGALPTYRMRRYACVGIWLFALTLTLAAIMWMKALQHEWFSTMYGVYYFAGSVWMTLGTVYVISMILDRRGVLTNVLNENHYYYLGSVLFAFTVFYAYVTFAQYFIIWNGNMPEETFWYVLREKGSWWNIGMIIIFGHFFIPFLTLLRIDVKLNFAIMVPVCLWTWLMHYFDLSFNIMPVLHPNGFVLHWMDLGCWAFMAGLMSWRFLKSYSRFAPYPLKDPRLIEAIGAYEHPPNPADLDQARGATNLGGPR